MSKQPECVEVSSQEQFERVCAAGDIAVVRSGWYEASGSATVRASGSATVEASKYVAVHKHAPSAVIRGGVLIEVPPTSDG